MNKIISDENFIKEIGYIRKKLEYLYDNKEIPSLSDLRNKDLELYNKIFALSKELYISDLDFLEHLGYKYCIPKKTIEYIIDNIHKYIYDENIFCIIGNDDFYEKFHRYCMSVYKLSKIEGKKKRAELIKVWGYTQIKENEAKKRGYDIYRTPCSKSIKQEKEDALIILKSFEENGVIYISHKSEEYKTITAIARRLGKSLTELIESFGFNHGRCVNIYSLNELKNIRSKPKKSTILLNKWIRNPDLVKAMKEFYEFKCQLCGGNNEDIPPIIKLNGKPYIEVHHIRELSSTLDESEGTDTEVDTPSNALVVCPYHHKYLHYYNGGMNKLIKQDEDYYISNKDNTSSIKIITNKHLKID